MKIQSIATLLIAATMTLVSNLLAQEKTQIDSTAQISSITFNQYISADNFSQGLVTDPIQLISGQAVGIRMIKVGSDPNVFSAPQIRGTTSMLNNGTPLYIIDGVVAAGISVVLPDEIESFEILKDAVSTARYGSLGVNGVILISTKSQNSNKKLTIEFNSNIAINSPAKRMELLSAANIRKFIDYQDINGFADAGASTDWQDEIFRNTLTQTYNLALHGQVKRTGYRVALFHQDNQGIVLGSSRQNTGINLHLTQQSINNKLKLRLTVSFSNPKSESIPTYNTGENGAYSSIFEQAFTRSTLHPVYQADGTTLAQYNGYGFRYYNPLAMLQNTENTNDTKHVNFDRGANYQIAKGLNFDINLGYNYLNSKNIYNQTSESMLTNGQEVTSETTVQQKHFNMEGTLSYEKSLGGNHHFKIGASCAKQFLDDENQSNTSRISMGSTQETYLSTITNEEYLSLIGQFDYNFKERYYIIAMVNKEFYDLKGDLIATHTPALQNPNYPTPYVDKFTQSNIYPAFTLAWKLHNESFIKPLKFISNLTLKGGYGFTGNNNYYKEQYFHQEYADINKLDTERTSEISLGLNVGLLKNRLTSSLTYYDRRTENGVSEISVASPPNIYGFSYANGDNFSNKGIEITISAVAVSTANLQWNTNITYFSNKNELVSRNYRSNNKQTGYVGDRDNNWSQIIKKNSPYPEFYMPVYAWKGSDGNPLFYTATYGGVTANPNVAERRVLGQITPEYELGWTNNFQIFKAFDASFAMRYLSGHSIYNATRAYLADPSLLPQYNATQEALINYNNRYSVQSLSSQYLEDASFLRLENVTVGYTLKSISAKWKGDVRFYLSGTNLLTFTKYKGLDPSPSATGIDNFNVYPLAKSFVVGIKLTL